LCNDKSFARLWEGGGVWGETPRATRTKRWFTLRKIFFISSRMKSNRGAVVSLFCRPQTAKYSFFLKAQEGKQNLSGKDFIMGNPHRGSPTAPGQDRNPILSRARARAFAPSDEGANLGLQKICGHVRDRIGVLHCAKKKQAGFPACPTVFLLENPRPKSAQNHILLSVFRFFTILQMTFMRFAHLFKVVQVVRTTCPQ